MSTISKWRDRIIKALKTNFRIEGAKESAKSSSKTRHVDYVQFEIPTNNSEDDFKLNHIVKAIENRIFNEAARFNYEGIEDGSNNLSNVEPMLEKAKTFAKLVIEPIKVYSDGKARGLRLLLKKRKRENEYAEKQFSQKSLFKNLLEHEFHENPGSFSLWLGIFYLLIAAALIIADIPLALDLIYKGLSLETAQSAGNTPIAELFYEPLKVLKGNWEVFFTAAGIALCTIYIKIFYDEFVGKSFSRQLIYHKKLKSDFNLTDDELDEVKNNDKQKKIIKSSVLIGSILMLIALGIFRYQTIINTSGSGVQDLFDKIGIIVGFVMIMLSFLFPIVGGICASIGLNCLMNRRAMIQANQYHNKAQSAWDKATNKFEEVRKKFAIWKSYLFQFMSPADRENWVKNEEDIEALNVSISYEENNVSDREEDVKKYLLSCYMRGYKKGLLNPTDSGLGEDLFDKAKRLRDKSLSRLSNNKIIRDSSIDFKGILNSKN